MVPSQNHSSILVFTEIVSAERLQESLGPGASSERERVYRTAVIAPYRDFLRELAKTFPTDYVPLGEAGGLFAFDAPSAALQFVGTVHRRYDDYPTYLPKGTRIGVGIGMHFSDAGLRHWLANRPISEVLSNAEVRHVRVLAQLAASSHTLVSARLASVLQRQSELRLHELGTFDFPAEGESRVYELVAAGRSPQEWEPPRSEAPEISGETKDPLVASHDPESTPASRPSSSGDSETSAARDDAQVRYFVVPSAFPESLESAWQRLRQFRRPIVFFVLLCIVATFLVWYLYGPHRNYLPRRVLGAELVTLNNPDAAPFDVGDWWFEQTPWLTPAFRDELYRVLDQVADPETQTPQRIRDKLYKIDRLFMEGRLGELQDALLELRDYEFMDQLGSREQQLTTLVESLDDTIGPQLISRLVELEGALRETEDPRERHLLGNVRHRLAHELVKYLAEYQNREETAQLLRRFIQRQGVEAELQAAKSYFAGAEADYQAALAAYEPGHPLRSLLLADAARLASEMDQPELAMQRIEQSLAEPVHERTILSKISLLCLQASLYRHHGDSSQALLSLQAASEVAAAYDEAYPDLAMHLTRLMIHERRGQADFEMWDLRAAELAFQRYAAGLAGQARQPDDKWTERLQVYSSHANLGQAMVLHYEGQDNAAIKLYETELATLGTSRRIDFRRRSLRILDRLADAYLFGPQPDVSASLAASRRYSDLQREVDIPPEPLRRHALKRCIALGAARQIDEACESYERLLAEEEVTSPKIELAAAITATYCGDEDSVRALVQLIEDRVEASIANDDLPHPHVVQLLLFGGERIAEIVAREDRLELALRNLETQTKLLAQVQGPATGSYPYLSRYIAQQKKTLEALAEQVPPDQLVIYRERLADLKPDLGTPRVSQQEQT